MHLRTRGSAHESSTEHVAAAGRRGARIACTAVAFAPIPGWLIATLTQSSGVGPREVWVALYFWSLLAMLSFASSIPHRIERSTADRKFSCQ